MVEFTHNIGVCVLQTPNDEHFAASVSPERSPFHILGRRRRPSPPMVHNQIVGGGTSVLWPRIMTFG